MAILKQLVSDFKSATSNIAGICICALLIEKGKVSLKIVHYITCIFYFISFVSSSFQAYSSDRLKQNERNIS